MTIHRVAVPDYGDKADIVCVGNVQPEPIQWLWPGRIALGKVSMLAGDPSLGKSLVTVTMAAHVTKGKPWPVDHSQCPQGQVVMLSAEDDIADTIRPRLDAAGADANKVHALRMIRTFDPETGELMSRSFSLKRDLAILDDILCEHTDCRLVVIDPISAYLDGTDSHKNSDVRGLLAPLSELASIHKVAVVVVTHLNKGGQANVMYRLIGSMAFVAAARAAWAVIKDHDDPSRRLVLPVKNNLGNDDSGLAYSIKVDFNYAPYIDWEEEPVKVSADDAMSSNDKSRTEREDAAEWLKQVLAGGPIKADEMHRLIDNAGHSKTTVQRAKKQAGVISKQVEFRGPHYWMIESQIVTDDTDCQSKDVAICGNRGNLRDDTEVF